MPRTVQALRDLLIAVLAPLLLLWATVQLWSSKLVIPIVLLVIVGYSGWLHYVYRRHAISHSPLILAGQPQYSSTHPMARLMVLIALGSLAIALIFPVPRYDDFFINVIPVANIHPPSIEVRYIVTAHHEHNAWRHVTERMLLNVEDLRAADIPLSEEAWRDMLQSFRPSGWRLRRVTPKTVELQYRRGDLPSAIPLFPGKVVREFTLHMPWSPDFEPFLADESQVVLHGPRGLIGEATPPITSRDKETSNRERVIIELTDATDDLNSVTIEMLGTLRRSELGSLINGLTLPKVAVWLLVTILALFNDEIKGVLLGPPVHRLVRALSSIAQRLLK